MNAYIPAGRPTLNEAGSIYGVEQMRGSGRAFSWSGFLIVACLALSATVGEACSTPVGVAPTIDASASVAGACTACLTAMDCPAHAECVQYDNSDYCAADCSASPGCSVAESCMILVSENGEQVSVCIPKSGTCNGVGCGTCAAGTTCSALTGDCEPDNDDIDAGAGVCNGEDPPGASSCCSSCTPGSSNCQSNGCYGGWYCNRASCKCQSPPSSCSSPIDAGHSGGADAGPVIGPDSGLITGNIGPGGGSVPLLYFAIVGDTRPPNEDDTANYPTAIITKIYQDIQAMNPRPQFIVTTGDFQFANPSGSESTPQLQAYVTARNLYSGTVFSTMGNHECTGYTNSNCTGSAGTASNNFQAFMSTLIAPLGQALPYYTIPFSDTNGQWTAKLIVTACNDWDATQKTWFVGQLANHTTYTFIARHEPPGAGAPCNTDMDPLVSSATYDLFIVGHSHTYSHSGKQIIEGVGGAPITGSANYGYAIVEQQGGGGFKVTQYDYQTAAPVNSFMVP